MNIFFDLDGTLVDSSERHYQVYKKLILGLAGVPLSKSDYWNLIRAKADKRLILQKSRVSADRAEQYLNSFVAEIELMKNLKLETLMGNNVLELLRRLKQSHTLFLITQRRQKKNAEKQVVELGLNKYFNKVIACDDKVSIIKSLLSTKLDENIVVGDTEADINAAKELGIKSVGLLSGFRNEKIIRALKPDYVCQNVEELDGVVPL